MKCIITGVAGFVGSTLAERLLKDGCSVIGIDSFTDYYPRAVKERNLALALKHPRFKLIEGDLLSLDLKNIFLDCEWVFHQAAQAGVRRSWGEYFSTYTNSNVLATQRVLEGVKGSKSLKKLVYASSSSVYGDAESFPTKELVIPRPVSPYGVTKLAAEHLAVLYSTEFQVPTASLRYFTVYGPRQRPDMAFHRFIAFALQGKRIKVYGDGEQSRDFTYIDDIVEANIAAAEKGAPGSVFNIGGGTQATVKDVLQIIRENIGEFGVDFGERQKGDARRTRADTTKAATELSFAPRVSLRDGISAEVEWLKGCARSGLDTGVELS